jgi:hypothetical protein
VGLAGLRPQRFVPPLAGLAFVHKLTPHLRAGYPMPPLRCFCAHPSGLPFLSPFRDGDLVLLQCYGIALLVHCTIGVPLLSLCLYEAPPLRYEAA